MRPGVLLLTVALLPHASVAQPARRAYPEVTIANTEVRSLRSSAMGRSYDLYVYLPSRLDRTSGRKYPVLHLLDGQWDFKLLASIQGGLLYDRFVPDVIVVGITYSGPNANYDSLRAVDYTPKASPSNPGSGQGAKFLAFLETELMPFVETNYPADGTRRGLMGNSLGGLFALYAMFTKPQLFAGYAAGSPAVTYANRGAFDDEAAFASRRTELPVKLYISVGDQEPLSTPVQEIVRRIRDRNYRGLTFESRLIAGERHSGNKPEALNRGMRFLFQQPPEVASSASATRIDRLDAALDALIAPDAVIEKLADGFEWAEGPVWRASGRYLMFSDVPRNTIYKWQEGAGLSVFLRPSGYIGSRPPGRELGSNGLTIDANDSLVMADHGNRQIARVNEAKFTKTVLADRYDGKRLNSPNDLAYRSNGGSVKYRSPFGLRGLNADSAKELAHNGVYRLTPAGAVTLLTSELAYPNGIAFSPDGKTLYVSNADATKPMWMAYDVQADGSLARGRVFFDATELVRAGNKGVPDGMRVDREGNVFAAAPGGVVIISPQGKHLGTIVTGQPTANVAFGDDGSTLYITANNQLMRVRLRTKGAGFN
jgi:gluconolactonase